MQLASAEDLIDALRGSGLFPREQYEELALELEPLGSDFRAMVHHLHTREHLTYYQLKKLLQGKAAELIIGPYIVTDKLGDGGMGKVYRAHKAEGEQETIALKVVRAALVANPVVRGRYAREVQTASTLAHPNIVHLYDAGEADGKFYLAMEFVDGVDLARLMAEFGRLEVAETCEYARQAALGLQHAHDKGFVHRDVKPSNIVVAGERHLPQSTEPAIVKVLDLGLARAMDPDDMVMPDLTRDHTVVGTPDYMAPEQAKNSRGADPRCDLYGLGCTMFFLLTGRVPFPHETALKKILAHQVEVPPPIQSLRPDVPRGVAEVVAKLLAKRPEDRIQTAGELAEILEPFARYAEGTPPVKIVSVRQEVSMDTARIGSTGEGAGAAPPAASSAIGSLAPLRLAEEESGPRPRMKLVSRINAKPEATSSAPESPPPAKSKPKPKTKLKPQQNSKPTDSTKRKSRSTPQSKPQPRAVPQFVWVLVALLGVAILGLLLWWMNR